MQASQYIAATMLAAVASAARIAAIEAYRARRTHRNAAVIHGTGLYLTPGLIDGHVHLGYIPGMRPDQEQSHSAIAQALRRLTAERSSQ